MNAEDKKEVLKNFESLLEKYGDDPRACQWRDQASQDFRFKILTEIADLNNRSVMDFGCGKADLFYYLRRQGINAKYTGYEISPAMVDFVKSKDPSCNILLRDIMEDGMSAKFDYILVSGTFNQTLSDNWQFFTKSLEIMWPAVQKGLAFNLVTTYVDYKESHLYYADPCKVYDWIKCHLTRFVTLRSDYFPFEYTVYAYKKS